MTEVVSVKFVSHGKIYYFDPNGVEAKAGDLLVVETSKGLDVGECAAGNHFVYDDTVVQPLRPLIRVATEEDHKTVEQNKLKEQEAFDICKEKIEQHGLDMKLVDVECSFEGNKILFFFTSDGRVDFRELVKDLASVFRTRIELRQIGVRDETKMLGGIGICGRPYCCSQFLKDFEPVSTKMAKTQSMSLNPTKISGSCGRLMCCLRYEQDAYEDLVKNIPKNGAFVQTVDGYGNVVQTNVLRQKVRVRIDGDNENEVKLYDADQVATVPGGRPKPGDELPDVLVYVAKEPEDVDPDDDPWKAPELFAVEEAARNEGKHAQHSAEGEEQRVKVRNRNPRNNKNGEKKNPQQPKSEKANDAAKLPNKQQNSAQQNAGQQNGGKQNAGQQQAKPKQNNGNNRNRPKRRPGKPKPQGQTGNQQKKPNNNQSNNNKNQKSE